MKDFLIGMRRLRLAAAPKYKTTKRTDQPNFS